MQNHCVGDVGHMKFVEADQAVFLCDAARDFVQRIGNAFQLVELAVHAAHEFVKMQPGLAHTGTTE